MKKTFLIALCTAYLLCSTEQSPTAVNAKSAYTAKIVATSLNVRSEPSISATVTSSLKQGDTVTVTDEQYGWMKVQAVKGSGWVAGYYLKKISSHADDLVQTSAGKAKVKLNSFTTGTVKSASATVAADSLRIRSGPGTNFRIQGSLKAGDTVTPLLSQNGWMRIRTVNGKTGWVASQYMRSGTAQDNAANTRKPSGSLKGKQIVIDPGHGGSDPGMVGTTFSTMEKNLNLKTALYVRDYLVAQGACVEMTRAADQKVALSRRVAISESLHADAFVSIHYNSSPKNVSGLLTFYYSKVDLQLAHELENRLEQSIGLKSNGVSFGNYHVLRENSTPSVLIELGFLSNPHDEAIVRNASYQTKAAKAIANGLADYFNR